MAERKLTSADIKVSIRPETRDKLQYIAREKLWTMTTVVDQAADALLARESLKFKIRGKQTATAA